MQKLIMQMRCLNWCAHCLEKVQDWKRLHACHNLVFQPTEGTLNLPILMDAQSIEALNSAALVRAVVYYYFNAFYSQVN